MKEARAYFDDGTHCNELKKLCSFSHPLAQNGKRFNSIKALQQELRNNHNVQFCPICLEGRKVFISEQLVYTKSQLNKHMKYGDDEGPMSTFSGFKGHPECVYCSKRFYSDNEQYEHMHRMHEECFLCKRVNPHTHVYYENYASLEGSSMRLLMSFIHHCTMIIRRIVMQIILGRSITCAQAKSVWIRNLLFLLLNKS